MINRRTMLKAAALGAAQAIAAPYVVREGKALGIATPVNRTLNALMKLLEQS